MYAMRGQFGMAKARYQRVDVASRVEGATPHQLVGGRTLDPAGDVHALIARLGHPELPTHRVHPLTPAQSSFRRRLSPGRWSTS